jgi:hypothetical protein
MSSPNLDTTPGSTPSLLFSASVWRKFLTMPSLSCGPSCFWSSWTICCLSETDRVGACRTSASLGSFLKMAASESSDLAVGSRTLVFAAAVYCAVVSPSHCTPNPSSGVFPPPIEHPGSVPKRWHMFRRRRRGPRAACFLSWWARPRRSFGCRRRGRQWGHGAHLPGERC